MPQTKEKEQVLEEKRKRTTSIRNGNTEKRHRKSKCTNICKNIEKEEEKWKKRRHSYFVWRQLASMIACN